MDWSAILTPGLGATGLLAVVVLLILNGRLVPKSTLDEVRADKDMQIGIWKAAYETSMSAQDVQRGHIAALLEANRATTHVIQAIPQAVHLNNEGGGRAAMAEAEGE
jgi:hypothetical protein